MDDFEEHSVSEDPILSFVKTVGEETVGPLVKMAIQNAPNNSSAYEVHLSTLYKEVMINSSFIVGKDSITFSVQSKELLQCLFKDAISGLENQLNALMGPLGGPEFKSSSWSGSSLTYSNVWTATQSNQTAEESAVILNQLEPLMTKYKPPSVFKELKSIKDMYNDPPAEGGKDGL